PIALTIEAGFDRSRGLEAAFELI
ncbi:MAG: hypothetical protein JWM16_3139, partial [Verrucomicrobiales bacterium]|nr:hypothetical protein [Verrucomicrobiales bacterium]